MAGLKDITQTDSRIHIPASTLPAAMVASLLLLLTGVGVLMLWEMDFSSFARLNRNAQDEENIRSALTLYESHPEILPDYDEKVELQLFDDVEQSKIIMAKSMFGLYEKLSISSGSRSASFVMGLREPSDNAFTFYTPNRGSAVNLIGKSIVKGRMALPKNGVSYNIVDGEHFSGEKVNLKNARLAQQSITPPDADMNAIANAFMDGGITERAEIEEGADTIIVADVIEVKPGARLNAQLFARDSVIIGSNAVLEYPSGVYCRNVVLLEDGCEVNGYVIIPKADDENNPVFFKQGNDSVLRGLLYADGNAMICGKISGSAYISQLVYDSGRGRYSNILFNARIVENRNVAYPLWLSADRHRKKLKTMNAL